MNSGSGKGELHEVVVGPEEFGVVAVGDVPAGGEDRVDRASSCVGQCSD